LKSFLEANNLLKSLSKKQIIEDSPQVKKFFAYFETHTKSKIKILEQLVNVKKISIDKNSKTEMNTSTLQGDLNIHQNFSNTTESKPQILNKEEILKIVENLITGCDKNLREIEESKKTAIQIYNMNNINNVPILNSNINIGNAYINTNKSIFLETTMIDQTSFYLPDLKNFGNLKIEDTSSPHKILSLKNHSRNDFSISQNISLIDRLQENFEFIKNKLTKLKILLDRESKVKEKKKHKQEKLEKLKQSYSMMKKIYNNAVRGGMKVV